MRGNEGLSPVVEIGIPIALAKLQIVRERGVGQRLVIGGGAEQSATNDIAGINRNVARNPRDSIPVIIERIGPQGRARALVGQARDDTNGLTVALDRPAQRISGRCAGRRRRCGRYADDAVRVEGRGNLRIHGIMNCWRQVGGKALKPGQADRHAVRNALR